MKILLTVLALCLLQAAPVRAEDDTTWKDFLGQPELQKTANGEAWVLETADKARHMLGSRKLLEEKNSRTASCLATAREKNLQVRIAGLWTRKKTGYVLDETSAVCATIRNRADCPGRTLETRHAEGTYGGVECGDYCHMLLSLKNGEELWLFADEEKAEKLLGTGTGQKVAITYTVEEDWTPESIESDAPYAPGSCGPVLLFKSGRVISK